jgi:hypothetical protein
MRIFFQNPFHELELEPVLTASKDLNAPQDDAAVEAEENYGRADLTAYLDDPGATDAT